MPADIVQGGGGVIEGLVCRGRDAVVAQQPLGECLRGFQAGTGAVRPEDRQSGAGKSVREPGREGCLRAD